MFYADFWKVRDRLQSHQFDMESSSHTTKEIEPITVAPVAVVAGTHHSLSQWTLKKKV